MESYVNIDNEEITINKNDWNINGDTWSTSFKTELSSEYLLIYEEDINDYNSDTNIIHVKYIIDEYKPDMIQAIPIFPQELFYFSYKNKISCPDPDCINGKRLFKSPIIL